MQALLIVILAFQKHHCVRRKKNGMTRVIKKEKKVKAIVFLYIFKVNLKMKSKC
jgi:hypothetical protein